MLKLKHIALVPTDNFHFITPVWGETVITYLFALLGVWLLPDRWMVTQAAVAASSLLHLSCTS